MEIHERGAGILTIIDLILYPALETCAGIKPRYRLYYFSYVRLPDAVEILQSRVYFTS